MLQRSGGDFLDDYLTRQRAFNRRRKKLRLSFVALHRAFASQASAADIARRANVSQERINFVFNRYFADLFGMTALERLRSRELARRDAGTHELARVAGADRALRLIAESAEKAKVRVEALVIPKRKPVDALRQKAVLVNGNSIAAVHHLTKARAGGRRRLAYASTTLSRSTLESVPWTIIVIDVPRCPTRIIRSSSREILQALFVSRQQRASAYIPLDGRPRYARYDFLNDENNWR
jgi:hypothetical protein